MRKILFLTLLIITAFPLFSENEEPLRFGLFPTFKSKTMVSIFKPVAELIELYTGREVRMVSAPSPVEFEYRTLSGEYDIIWTSNALFFKVRDHAEFRVIAGGEPSFTGVVMVRKDSGLQSLEDLSGKNIVSTNPESLAGYLFFRNLMAEKDLHPERDYSVTFNGSIESLPFLVINRKFDAVVFSADTYARTDIYKFTSEQLKVIARSIPIPQFPFAVSPEVDETTAWRIQSALISINSDTDNSRKILHELKLERISAKSNADYEDFEKLYLQNKAYTLPEFN